MAQTGRRLVRHGKHRYRTFAELANSDRDYVSWVLRSESLPTSLRDFARFVRSEYGGMLMVGKHRMSYFTEILERDPAYCVWVAQLEAPTGSMKSFQEFLDVMEVVRDSSESEDEAPAGEPAAKAPRRVVTKEEPGDQEELNIAKKCVICFDSNSYSENHGEDSDVDAVPALLPDGVFHHTARTPLWTAVDVACNYGVREGNDNERDIVKLLLRYLARPDQCGNVEYHRVADGNGNRRVIHMTDGSTTPWEIARRACEDVPRDLFELLRSHGMAQKRPRDDGNVEFPPNRPRCADQA